MIILAGRCRNMALRAREAYRTVLRKYPDVLDVKQAGEILGVSTKTIYKLIRTEEMPFIKAGRAYRIPKIMILQYMKLLQNKDNCI